MPITITICITPNNHYCIAQNIFVTDVHRCIIRNNNKYWYSLRCFTGTALLSRDAMTVLQPVAHWPKIDHAQAARVWKTVAINLNLIFITIGALEYPILTIIASPIVADFQYVVYKYFTQIINVTDILLQFFWGRILYSLDYMTV